MLATKKVRALPCTAHYTQYCNNEGTCTAIHCTLGAILTHYTPYTHGL
jgi:hypothetical protein